MNIIIAGDNEIGLYLAKIFSSDNHNITVINHNEEVIKNLEFRNDVLTIHGNSSDISTLRDAKVENADLLISVFHEEKDNITTGILGKKLGAKKVIARINNLEYLLPENREIFKSLGIDEILCPEKIAANEIVRLLNIPAAIESFNFSDGKLSLFMVRLEKNSPVIGKSLIEIARDYPELDFRAVAIYRNSKTIIPKGNDIFYENDLAYVITKSSKTNEIIKLSGKEIYSINNVMIVGGGRIGKITAQNIENNLSVKLIENSYDRCMVLTEHLTNTLIIKGDGRNFQLLEEEEIRGMDAFIAVTEDSETNIFTCLMAKRLGVKKTIALVENIDYFDLSHNIGIDTIINKKLITAGYIARFTKSAEVSALKYLSGVDADAMEFIVRKDAKITKKSIFELNFPKGAIIAGIVRDDKSYIAVGNMQIQENDRVVVFSLPDCINEIEKFFK